MVNYEPTIISEFVEKLYRRADGVVVIYTLIGIVIGGGLGGTLDVVGAGVIGVVIGAAILGFLGFLIAQGRAFELKLQAQVALCQVQIEENTRPTPTTDRGRAKASPVMMDKMADGSSFARVTKHPASASFTVTEQEKALLNLWAQGLTITEIADKLNVTEDQVIRLQSELKQRFGVYSNADLIQRAKERGYLVAD